MDLFPLGVLDAEANQEAQLRRMCSTLPEKGRAQSPALLHLRLAVSKQWAPMRFVVTKTMPSIKP